jgi:hypothetical protein
VDLGVREAGKLGMGASSRPPRFNLTVGKRLTL